MDQEICFGWNLYLGLEECAEHQAYQLLAQKHSSVEVGLSVHSCLPLCSHFTATQPHLFEVSRVHSIISSATELFIVVHGL